MDHNNTKQAEIVPEYDTIDNAIINMVQADPEITTNAIGSRLVQIGLSQGSDIAYKRLSRKDYLRRDIAEIRENHRQRLSRELVPLALKVTTKALKSKDLSLSKKQPYVALALKAELGEKGTAPPAQTVNIEHLERMQVLIQQDIGSES